MGEKFSANPSNRIGSLSVPLVSKPGRAGFGPRPSLTYNSGAHNGVFGVGWHLGPPSITRKTDKGLLRYLDHDESDVFLISGSGASCAAAFTASLTRSTSTGHASDLHSSAPALLAARLTATQGGNHISSTDGPVAGTIKTFAAKDVGSATDRRQLTIADTTTPIGKLWLLARYTLPSIKRTPRQV